MKKFMWGEQAIEMASGLGNSEILSHALNNVGSVQMSIPSFQQKAIAMLHRSLEIALKHSYHEHAARAYTNLGSSLVKIRNYTLAGEALEEGIRYCEVRDLNSWSAYMLSWKARLNLETGNWAEAVNIAENLLRSQSQPAIIKITALIALAKVRMRTGEKVAPALLMEAKTIAFETMELQRVIPSMVALLEYEWLTGNMIIESNDIEDTCVLMQRSGIEQEKKELAFWMKKAGRHFTPLKEEESIYDLNIAVEELNAAAFWNKSGCPYEEALVMFEGKDDDKRKAIAIISDLGAIAVYEKMKQEMRNLGIKNIPRGIRNSTRSNEALLTGREMEILQLLKEDLQNKEIAAKLYISPKTVDHHISSILFKLDAHSRSKAVAEAIRRGVLK